VDGSDARATIVPRLAFGERSGTGTTPASGPVAISGVSGSSGQDGAVLLRGINHVAVLTNDTDRLTAFYLDVFDAPSRPSFDMPPGMRLTFIDLAPDVELNVFQVDGNTQADIQEPDFERGRLDHFGLLADSQEAFVELRRRLVAAGATDGFVTDFGPVHSVFFRDPDGLASEVCWAVPGADLSIIHPPGTPAEGYEPLS
jgi:catechol 2,3-dioxygenase-like lactoylglutathione lyase family enzyme